MVLDAFKQVEGDVLHADVTTVLADAPQGVASRGRPPCRLVGGAADGAAGQNKGLPALFPEPPDLDAGCGAAPLHWSALQRCPAVSLVGSEVAAEHGPALGVGAGGERRVLAGGGQRLLGRIGRRRWQGVGRDDGRAFVGG